MSKIATIEELTTRIHSELTVGEKLLELGRQKKQAVITNQVDEITRLNQEENDTLHELEELGFERQELVLQIAKSEGLRVTERLKDLITQINDPTTKSSLIEQRELLVNTYGKIAEITQVNGELLAQSIRVTKQMFDRFSHVDRRSKNSNYDRFKKSGPKPSYHAPTFNHKG
jgi:hypothetical protein